MDFKALHKISIVTIASFGLVVCSSSSSNGIEISALLTSDVLACEPKNHYFWDFYNTYSEYLSRPHAPWDSSQTLYIEQKPLLGIWQSALTTQDNTTNQGRTSSTAVQLDLNHTINQIQIIRFALENSIYEDEQDLYESTGYYYIMKGQPQNLQHLFRHDEIAHIQTTPKGNTKVYCNTAG